jgi:hypothetical protein
LTCSTYSCASPKRFALAKARSPLIAFLDADDIWLPHKLNVQVRLLEDRPEAGLVHGGCILIDKRGTRAKRSPPAICLADVPNELFLGNSIKFSSVMIRRSCLDECGSFNNNYNMCIDYDLWLRMSLRYAFACIDEPLILRRVGHQSLSVCVGWSKELDEVDRIRADFLASREGRAAIHSRTLRAAYVQRCCTMALSERSQHPATALRQYLRALRISPLSTEIWRGLLSLDRRGRSADAAR